MHAHAKTQNILLETEFFLESWGRWNRDNGLRIGYNSPSFWRSIKGSTVRSFQISDDTGFFISSIVSDLKNIDELEHDATVLRYCCGWSDQEISEYVDANKKKVWSARKNALHYVSGRLG